MPTSIHIPKPLLNAVDRRARQLKLSRNSYIVHVLKEELARGTEWSSGFFKKLSAGIEDVSAIDEMLQIIQSRRKSKKPLKL